MNTLILSITILSIVISMPLAFAESIEVELDETLGMTTGDEKPKQESKEKTVELDETLKMVIEDEKPKQTSELPPLKQIKEGIEPQDIQCKSSMELIFKHSGEPSCVKPSSVEKLISRGWTR